MQGEWVSKRNKRRATDALTPRQDRPTALEPRCACNRRGHLHGSIAAVGAVEARTLTERVPERGAEGGEHQPSRRRRRVSKT